MATRITLPLPESMVALRYQNDELLDTYSVVSGYQITLQSKNCQYLSIEIPKLVGELKSNSVLFSIVGATTYYAPKFTYDAIYFITDSPTVPEYDILNFSSTRKIPKNLWYRTDYQDFENYTSSGSHPINLSNIPLSAEILALDKIYLHITTRESVGYDNSHIADSISFDQYSFPISGISYLSYNVTLESNVQDGGTVSGITSPLNSDNMGSVELPSPTHSDTTVVKEIKVKGKGNGGLDISSEGSITTESSYDFLYWEINGSKYSADEQFYPTGDCKLEASWNRNILNVSKDLPAIGATTRENTREVLTIYLDANGGNCDIKEVTSEYTKSYELKEWNTVAAGIGFSYPVGSTFEDSITLYAIWETTSADYTNIHLPIPTKRDAGSYELNYLGWSTKKNSLIAEYRGELDLQTVASIEDSSTFYAVYNIPEINYSLYLGTKKLKNLYLGTKEIKFCIHENDRLNTLGYSPKYYYIIPREYPMEDANVDLLYLTPAGENTSWIISPTEPTNPEEGMVWIQTISSGASTFTINDTPVYLVRAAQYTSGKWIYNDTAKVRKDGVWTDFGYSYDFYVIPRGTSIEDSNLDLLYMDISQNTEHTPWVISPTEPISPEEGMVWIKSILLGTGGVQIGVDHFYLLRGYQYTSAEWIYNETTRIRESGIWSDFGYDEYHIVIPRLEDYSEVNVIKVNTDVKTNTYNISSETPTYPEEGMVWITPNPYNSPINPAIVIGDTYTYPKICKQYISGSWVEKIAETYEDGVYTKWWDGYIFKSGVLDSKYTLVNNSNVSLGDNIQINYSESSSIVRGGIEIDCSIFNWITVKGAFTKAVNTYSSLSVGICPITYDPYSSGLLFDEEELSHKESFIYGTESETTFTFNLSDINEKCHLIFYGTLSGGYISEILCE